MILSVQCHHINKQIGVYKGAGEPAMFMPIRALCPGARLDW